jgi:hypothetical protein
LNAVRDSHHINEEKLKTYTPYPYPQDIKQETQQTDNQRAQHTTGIRTNTKSKNDQYQTTKEQRAGNHSGHQTTETREPDISNQYTNQDQQARTTTEQRTGSRERMATGSSRNREQGSKREGGEGTKRRENTRPRTTYTENQIANTLTTPSATKQHQPENIKHNILTNNPHLMPTYLHPQPSANKHIIIPTQLPTYQVQDTYEQAIIYREPISSRPTSSTPSTLRPQYLRRIHHQRTLAHVINGSA